MATWWHKAGQKCDFFSRDPDHRNISPSNIQPTRYRTRNPLTGWRITPDSGDSIQKPANQPNWINFLCVIALYNPLNVLQGCYTLLIYPVKHCRGLALMEIGIGALMPISRVAGHNIA